MTQEQPKQKILGGFYIYRVIPSEKISAPIEKLENLPTEKFQQTPEITGIVIIKYSVKINQKIFLYAPMNSIQLGGKEQDKIDEAHRAVRTFISSDSMDSFDETKHVYSFTRMEEFVDRLTF